MSVSADLEGELTEAWDVAVVGAGPAGAVAARGCARLGMRTLLVDKAVFPRRKVCGCCLNRAALAGLASAGLGELPARLGAVPLRRVRLASDGRSADLRWPGGVSLSREAFDAELVREAERAGATVRTGMRAVLGEEQDGYRRLTLVPSEPERQRGSGERARVVIAADGLNGRLAADAERFEVPAADGSRIGAGVVLDDAPSHFVPGTVYMATAAGGYVGLVRLEDGRLDVAAAFDPRFVRTSGGLGPAADAVLRSAGLPDIDLSAADWRGTPALTRRPPRVAGRRWFAVGDAAGYVEPFTGEGMGWAIGSAVAVAPIIERAVAGWDDRLIRTWTDAHRRTVGRRQATCRAVAWVLRRPAVTNGIVRALQLIPAAASPVVHLLHRPVKEPT